MRIYVASSWRNTRQPRIVAMLRELGHEVYDFRNPNQGDAGFSWSEIDPNWKQWDGPRYLSALEHPAAKRGFAFDMQALINCDACVLVLPCGRSAHLELGQACGARRYTVALLDEPLSEPELMYKMLDRVCSTEDELRAAFTGNTFPHLQRDEGGRG